MVFGSCQTVRTLQSAGGTADHCKKEPCDLHVCRQMLPRALEEPPAAEALEEDRSQPGSEAQQDMFRDNGLLMRKIKDTGGVGQSPNFCVLTIVLQESCCCIAVD